MAVDEDDCKMVQAHVPTFHHQGTHGVLPQGVSCCNLLFIVVFFVSIDFVDFLLLSSS